MSSTSHLAWTAEAIPVGIRSQLLGPGAPFELGHEDVLGQSMRVFTRRPHSLRELLDKHATDVPDKVFLVAPERNWTYAQALTDIDAIAGLLAVAYGVRAGDRVAVVAANSAEYGLLIWAVLSLGAVVTSLNGWWTEAELRYGISLTSPVLIVGDERRLERLGPESVPAEVPVRRIDELHREAVELHGRGAPRQSDIGEDDPAVILFTSGTTGRPKGATLSHRNIINFACVSALGAATRGAMAPAGGPTPRPATILTSPLFHISGLVAILIIGPTLHTTLVFAPPGPWNPTTYLQLTEQHRVTSWSGVPTQFWRLLRHPDLDSYDLSSVMGVGGGGAVFAPELVREVHRRMPQVGLGNGYGMSETVGLGTLTGGQLFLDIPESVGGPQPTVEVQIRAEDGAVLPAGDVGEIHLRTPSVFLGYWNDPDATAAVLDDQRWYRTGDYGRVANGLLFLESRRRDLILRGGENIYPIEIENRLIEHPDIADAAAIGVDHLELGQEVKAFVVLHDGHTLTAEDVRSWCRQTLASYKVPAHVEFRQALPYTLTGKLMKTQLESEERANRG